MLLTLPPSDLLVRHDTLSHAAGSKNASATSKRANGRRVKTNRPRHQAPVSDSASINLPVQTPGTIASIGDVHNEPPQLQPLAVEENSSSPVAEDHGFLADSSLHTESLSHIGPAPGDTVISHNALSTDILNSDIDYETSFDDFTSFIDSVGMPSQYYPSMFHTAQPVPYFSPDPIFDIPGTARLPNSYDTGAGAIRGVSENEMQAEDHTSFSRFGSRLPSLQPEPEPISESPQHGRPQAFWNFSMEDRQCLLDKLTLFQAVISEEFQLPSRHAMSRYTAGYVSGFHDHLPFIHIPTISVKGSAPELVLAIAAIGCQYCFESPKGVEIFKVAKAIAVEQIRRRERELSQCRASRQNCRPSGAGFIAPETPSTQDADSLQTREDSIQTLQALLLLLAMATWGDHEALFREALSIQSTLATLIRHEGLLAYEAPADSSWGDWIRYEGAKRTKFVVFCFFNFHCIIYNTAPSILSAELNMNLPCWESEWRAATASAWEILHRESRPEPSFQACFLRLFPQPDTSFTVGAYSSLGSYILVHALIQHIFLVRQVMHCRPGSDGSLPSSEVSILEQALKRWQNGWEHNPESSLDPHDPHGPVAFNSTALLRMAYIRLSVDIGPVRALDTQDPILIARAIYRSPPIKRSRKLTRAALHAAHALSIPIKLGVNLVARNQIFTWSIQHSLCSLECAFILSKWLEAVSCSTLQPPLNEDEKRLLAFVVNMLKETDFAPNDKEGPNPRLSAKVVKVWAKLFRGGGTIWDIVDIIGRALDLYAELLDNNRTR